MSTSPDLRPSAREEIKLERENDKVPCALLTKDGGADFRGLGYQLRYEDALLLQKALGVLQAQALMILGRICIEILRRIT